MFLWNQIPDHLCTDFSFPVNKSELLSDDSACLLSQARLFSEEIKSKLISVCDDITTSPLYIIVHFNILASSLHCLSDIHKSITFEVLNTLIGGGRELVSFIRSISDNSKSIQTTAKQNCILTSCLKRLVYLVSEIFVEFFRLYFKETEMRRRSNISKGMITCYLSSADLVILCEKFLEFTNSVISVDINIHVVFSPPVPESTIDTIRVMFAPVYLILNQHTLLKKLSLKIVQSITLCLNRFPFLLIDVGIQISEVLQYTDPVQVVGPVIQNFLKQIIELIPNLCGQIIREIASRMHLDKDIPEVRILGSVLATVACCDHVQVKSNLNYIAPLLSAECFTIRNGALTALSEIIRGNYNTQKGSTKQNEICSVSHFKEPSKYGLCGITFDTLEGKLLNTLIEHLFDINAFVRSRCIQLINTLWESGSIPLVKQNKILQFLIRRLLDKSAIVRKQSALSLVMAIKKQPYETSILDIVSFQQCLQRELKILREIESGCEICQFYNHFHPIDTVLNTDIQEILKINENVNMIEEDPINEDSLYSKFASEISIGFIPDCIAAFDWLKRYIPDKTIFQNEELKEQIILSLTNQDLLVLSTIIRRSKLEEKQIESQYNSQKLKVTYLQSAIEFIEILESCLPTAIKLLDSKIHSDVTSAIAFLTEYRKFKLSDHLICIKPILYLIWSPQQTHQECALCCFSEFFMNICESQHDYDIIAQTLYKNLLININYREFYTFEKIVMTLVKRKEFPPKLTVTLFKHFILSQKLIGTSIRTNALTILCMIGKGDPNVLYHNMYSLVDNCFTEGVLELDIVKCGCRALNIITSYQNKQKYNIPRFINTHTIFNSILILLTTSIFDFTADWTCLMHEAMLLIFQLSQSPLELCQLVIFKCSTIFQIILNEEKRITGISRFFCLLGKVAQLHLIMIDAILCTTENSKSNETYIHRDVEYSKEDEQIQIYGSNSCYLLECLICEKSLLSKYTHIIVQILKDQKFLNFASEFTNHKSTLTLSLILQLQSSALFTFSQFMLLSNHLCERYLNLIITLMTKHPSSFLRISCLNALSDLTLRYPNTLQPWIPCVFMVLRDSNHFVRKHALLIISHLIHIDMVKIQGYIVEIAYLIYDEDPYISELAHCFYLSIAQEGNSLYNVLPDILSHMFDLENNYLEINKIKQILKFLLSFIRNEKQTEHLVLKFLQRLKSAKDNKQSELISYSISLLPMSENTLSVLVAEFFTVSSVIFDEQTKSHFENIYNIFRRQPNSHQELKILLNKYFELLNSITIN